MSIISSLSPSQIASLSTTAIAGLETTDIAARLDRAFQLTLGRIPTDAERQTALAGIGAAAWARADFAARLAQPSRPARDTRTRRQSI